MNGGIYATRGYLFQYLICILDSFQSPWHSIIVEPDTDKEKVDILWILETTEGEYKKKAVQVKSTQNKFNGEKVKREAEYLKNHFKADEYEFILIGRVPDTLLEYLQENENQHEGVKIPNPKILDLEAITALACHKLDKYIDANYATHLPWQQRENLVHSLIGKLQYYSTTRREVTRENFEANLKYWIESHTDITDYEMLASDKFRRFYGFEASPNLRIAIDKFFKQSSRKVKKSFFKECDHFLTTYINTTDLKVVYPKSDMISFYLGSFIQLMLLIPTAFFIYLYVMIYAHWLCLMLFAVCFLFLLATTPFVRPYYLARIIDNELKEIRRVEFNHRN